MEIMLKDLLDIIHHTSDNPFDNGHLQNVNNHFFLSSPSYACYFAFPSVWTVSSFQFLLIYILLSFLCHHTIFFLCLDFQHVRSSCKHFLATTWAELVIWQESEGFPSIICISIFTSFKMNVCRCIWLYWYSIFLGRESEVSSCSSSLALEKPVLD